MLKKECNLSHLTAKAQNRLPEHMQIFLLDGGRVRGALLDAPVMLNQMQANHELGVIGTLVLGHAYLAAGLLSCNLSEGERLALQIDGSGPLKGLVVEANAAGEVRGYLRQTELQLDKPLESFDMAPFIGLGFLKVTKYLQNRNQPFTGQVVLQSSNLAEDLAYYFLTSEQIPTAFNLSVKFTKSGLVAAAGGLFLQALPGAGPDVLQAITEKVRNMPSLSELLAPGLTTAEVLTNHFTAFDLQLLEEKAVSFYCHCSKARFSRFLSSLPAEELEDMLATGPLPVITTCHNCNSAYAFSEEELRALLENSKR